MTRVTIYGLCDPDTGYVRYIGQTRNVLDARLKAHLGPREPNLRKREWIDGLRARGLEPTIGPIDVVAAEEAHRAEAFHINDHLARGCDLVNVVVNPGPAPVKDIHADDRITVSFPASIGRELRETANDMAIPVSILIKQWTVQRLHGERQPHARRDAEEAP